MKTRPTFLASVVAISVGVYAFAFALPEDRHTSNGAPARRW
jgi:hypothetical protein